MGKVAGIVFRHFCVRLGTGESWRRGLESGHNSIDSHAIWVVLVSLVISFGSCQQFLLCWKTPCALL